MDPVREFAHLITEKIHNPSFPETFEKTEDIIAENLEIFYDRLSDLLIHRCAGVADSYADEIDDGWKAARAIAREIRKILDED